jgi:rod shape-determining protein MreD
VIQRVAALTLLLVTGAVLQTALLPRVAIGGIRPNLLLLIVLGFAIKEGVPSGLRIGFVAGLLFDLLADQAPVGIATLVYTAVGYAVGAARPYLAPGSLTAPLLLAFLSGLLGTAGYGVLTFLLGDAHVGGTQILQASLGVALFNTLLAPAAVAVVRRLSDRFPTEGGTAPLR